MTGELSLGLREWMLEAVAGRADNDPMDPNYKVSLVSSGTELPVLNGYLRAEVRTGRKQAATWSRALTVITVNTGVNHNMANGAMAEVLVSDDLTALPLGSYAISAASGNSFTIVSPASGTLAGPRNMTFQTARFWTPSTFSDSAILTQVPDIVFPAASGSDWTFDELRLHDPDVSGGYLMSFKWDVPNVLPDGNTLRISSGTLVINDLSSTLS